MKITAHLIVAKGYGTAITASQWKSELLTETEEHNSEYYGEDEYLSQPRDRAVVTVEFEVPDSIFERQPTLIIQGILIETEQT